MRFSLILFFLFLFQCLNAQKTTESNDTSLSFILKGADYYFEGDFIMAQQEFLNALTLRNKIYGSNHVSLAHAYNNLGLVAMKTWSYEKAIDLLKNAERIYLLDKNSIIDLANTYTNIGSIYRQLGEYSLAEQYYNHTIQILSPIQNKEAYQRLSECYFVFGMLENRRNKYEKAIVFFKKAIPSKNYSIEPVVLHNIYSNISDAYLNLNNFDSAYYFLQKSLHYAKTNKLLPKKYYASSLIGLASYCIKTNNKKALDLLNQSLNIYKSLEIDSLHYFWLYNEYANYYNTFQQYPKAIEYYQKSIAYLTSKKLQETYNTPGARSYIEPVNGISVLKKKSECLIGWYKENNESKLLQSALESLLVASELVDLARNGYLTMESKLSIAKNEAPIYKMGIWCAYQLFLKTNNNGFLDKAFYFADKSKSSILEATLQEEKAKSFAGIPDSLLEKELNLKREIAFYNEQIYEEQRAAKSDSSKLSIWNNYLFEFTKQKEKLKNYLEKNYPEYYTLKYVNTTVGLKKIQDIIDKNTSVIEYSITDSLLYIFHITKNSARIYCSALEPDFYLKTSEFLDQFRNFNYLSQGKYIVSDYEKTASGLFNTLISPINYSTLREKIIIIPDDILSYLPFETLVLSDYSGNSQTYADLNYIFLDHIISYSYSSSLYNESWKKTHRKLFNRVLSVAPDYNNNNSLQSGKRNINTNDLLQFSLKELPFAVEEVNEINRIAHGRKLLGSTATTSNFIKASSSYDILHLAMHTIIDDNNPMYSKFVFTNIENGTDTNLLTTNELYGLKLKARLAVLSSCSSGEGKLKKGEGVVSLARGFFYAGCPSLVMTLWEVEDESGLQLMKSFYKYLLKGYSKPKALQKAKTDYLASVPQEKQHPFYWSTYICIGNTTPIYYSRWLLFPGMVLLIVIGLAIRKIKSSRKKRYLNEPFPYIKDRL